MLSKLFGRQKEEKTKPSPKPNRTILRGRRKLERQEGVYDFNDEGIFESSSEDEPPRRAMFSPSTKSTKSTAPHMTTTGTADTPGHKRLFSKKDDSRTIVPPTLFKDYKATNIVDLSESTKINTKKNKDRSLVDFRDNVQVATLDYDTRPRSEVNSAKYLRTRKGGKKSKKQNKTKKQRKSRRC